MKTWTCEVRTFKKHHLLSRFLDKGNGIYIYTASKKECKKMQKQLERKGIYGFLYKEKYGRSNNYRQTYLSSHSNQERFRCVYCGKIINKEDMVIDHIIPVSLAKRSIFARLILKLRRCNGVNDEKNLVPSCQKCNTEKSNDLNIKYMLISRLGSHDFFRFMLLAVQILIVIISIYIIILHIPNLKPILANLKGIYQMLIQKN